ncbi:MAG: hypothetical protein AB1607_11390 [Chloroflexota bacterium]
MKHRFFIPFAMLMLASLACGFPSAAPVEPTVNSLPPTPDMPAISSPVVSNPVQSTATASVSFSSTVREEFDGKISPGLGWDWLRHDPAGWSLTATPGWLRINVSTSSYLTGLPANVLVTPAPSGDFDLRTSLNFSPVRNFEFAGLVIVFGEKSVLQFGHAFCDAPTCVGNGYYFDNLQNGTTVGGNFATPASGNLNQLRVVRTGNLYTAYYLINGNWAQVGSHTVDSQPLSVGLIAAQAQAEGGFAEFDWFEIGQP